MDTYQNSLTRLGIPADGGTKPQDDHSLITRDVKATVIFHRQREQVIRFIEQAAGSMNTVCFGAVAWLTDLEILEAMSKLPTVMLVQKEDFLRPDTGNDQPGWEQQLRSAYDRLPEFEHGMRYHLPWVAGQLSILGDPGYEPVRCIGQRPNPSRNSPRMHHKFLVMARYKSRTEEGNQLYWRPYAVWTGSYNMTQMGSDSWENSLILENPEIARAYLNEWTQLFAMSEPLDWTSPYVNPQWRIGT